MYLYNGHRAPGLPVYDPAELPYGLIVSSNADNTALILMLCVNRPYYGVNPQDSTKTGVYNTGRMKVYTCTDTDEAWTFSMETDNPLTANDDDPGGGVLWTLEDILKTDGSVWMAGTQPVPERVTEAWVRSFQEGLALGLTGNPLPYNGTAEPVAYLYNGVRLPKIPEVEGYPYRIMITAINNEDGTLRHRVVHYFADNAYYTQTENNLYFGGVASSELSSEKVAARVYTLDGDTWSLTSDRENNATVIPPPDGWTFWGVTRFLTWANFNVEYDGMLYMAESTPVPVYE